MADLAKENVAWKTSKKSVELAHTSKVEHCDVLEKEVVHLRTRDTSASTPVSCSSHASTSKKVVLADKENAALVSQVS